MKYDCALIQDVVSLYQEEVLSARSREIVTEHLAVCPACKAYYGAFSAADSKMDPDRLEAGSLYGFANKIKEYHFYQIGVFVFSIISMLTVVLPWFGREGITEVKGTLLFSHPAAILGFALFQFAIWFHFENYKKRMLWGYAGIGLVLITEIYVFLTITTGGTTGIDFFLFHFDVPYLDEINLLSSFSNARFGFYAGFLATVWDAIAFSVLIRKLK